MSKFTNSLCVSWISIHHYFILSGKNIGDLNLPVAMASISFFTLEMFPSKTQRRSIQARCHFALFIAFEFPVPHMEVDAPPLPHFSFFFRLRFKFDLNFHFSSYFNRMQITRQPSRHTSYLHAESFHPLAKCSKRSHGVVVRTYSVIQPLGRYLGSKIPESIMRFCLFFTSKDQSARRLDS